MRKLIRSVLETPSAEHIFPKTISRPKSMLTVILYFSDIKPPLTEQFDLFDLEARESGIREVVAQTRPTDTLPNVEYRWLPLISQRHRK